MQVKIKVGLPLTTPTTKLGYKLLHGNPLSVSYSITGEDRAALGAAGRCNCMVGGVSSPLQVALGFIIICDCFAIEVSYETYWLFACVQQMLCRHRSCCRWHLSVLLLLLVPLLGLSA